MGDASAKKVKKKLLKKKAKKEESASPKPVVEKPSADTSLEKAKTPKKVSKKAPKNKEPPPKEPSKEAPKNDSKKAPKNKEPPPKDPIKEALAVQAVAEISRQVDDQKGGGLGCPVDWHEKYKTVLGSYKKFVLARPELYSVTNVGPNFIVTKAGTQPTKEALENLAAGRKRDWKRALSAAWAGYCTSIDDAQISADVFVAAAKEVSKTVVPKRDNAALLAARAATPVSPKELASPAPAAKAGNTSDKATPKKKLKKKKKAV